MTIDELLAAAGLTANDEIPIWDKEATGEPTKKITAANLASAVVTLANLVTGVKGNAEAENAYRHGNVNLTPANIGALPISGGQMNGNINLGEAGATTISHQIIWTAVDGCVFYLRTYNNQLQLAYKPSGGSVAGVLNVYSDGTIGLTRPAAWRNALGLVIATGTFQFSNLAAGAQAYETISATLGTTNYMVVTQPNVSRCAIGVQALTASGFDLYCRNMSDSTSSPIIRWAAINLA